MASPFASQVTTTVPLPHDPPHEVTVQKLPGRHLRRAQQAHFNEIVAGIAERGGSKIQKDLQILFEKTEKDPTGQDATALQQAKADPLAGYDAATLVAHGVKSWTYSQPVTPAALAELDEETEQLLARAILRLTKPALFLSEEDAKAAQKETHADSSIA